jgi:hypothetical protein
MINTRFVETQALFSTGCDRIEETEPFDIASITWITAVSHYNVEEWPFFGASSGKTYGYHFLPLLNSLCR